MTDESRRDRKAADEAGFERITPASIRPADAADNHQATPAAGVSMRPLLIGMAVLLALLLAVTLWLPRQLAESAGSERQPAKDQTAAGAVADERDSSDEASPPVSLPADADRLLAARQQAQEQLQTLRSRLEALDDRAVTRWADAEAAELRRAEIDGAEALNRRDFERATTIFTEAVADADALLQRTDRVRDDALVRGDTALDAGNPEVAEQAFSLALAIDGRSEAARTGLQRAKNYDAVQALLMQGRSAEDRADFTGAIGAYEEALTLDAASTAAREGRTRARQRQAATRFRQHMSRGMAALDREDFSAAQQAFNAALAEKPGDAAARDGLLQARAGEARRAIADHLTLARRMEDVEHWARARTAYTDALAIDESLASARDGLARSERRLHLDQRLQGYIDQPDRLSDDGVRADAAAALEAARNVDDPGAKLQSQIAQLAGLVTVAATPVSVTLQSDGNTRVTVYHVGELGRFERHTLSLRPGAYTAIGQRSGYRDVRQRFRVTQSGLEAPVVIRCEERI